MKKVPNSVKYMGEKHGALNSWSKLMYTLCGFILLWCSEIFQEIIKVLFNQNAFTSLDLIL